MRACGVLVHEDRILLIECYDEPVGRHYNIPGGGVEQDEPILDAVRREMLEETGYQVSVGRLLLTYESLHEDAASPQDKHHSFGLLFECHLVPGTQPDQPAVPDAFQTGLKWVPLSRLLALPLLPDIGTDLLAVLRGYVEAPAFARHTYTPGKLPPKTRPEIRPKNG